MVKTIYYTEPTDDVVQSAHQDFQLPDDFCWLRTKPAERCWSLMVRSSAKAFAYLYTYGYRQTRIAETLPKTGILCLWQSYAADQRRIHAVFSRSGPAFLRAGSSSQLGDSCDRPTAFFWRRAAGWQFASPNCTALKSHPKSRSASGTCLHLS